MSYNLLFFWLLSFFLQSLLNLSVEAMNNLNKCNYVEFSKNRLPNHIVPTHYELFFDLTQAVNLQGYRGSVSIHIEINRPDESTSREDRSQVITLHADNSLEFTGIEFEERIAGQDPRPIRVHRVESYKEYQMVRIVLEDCFSKRGLLRIMYQGRYHFDTLRGLYQKSYARTEGPLRYVASSFFPTDARMAFPCFDEPAFKATFKLKVRHFLNEFALSNWPIESSFGDMGVKTSTFRTTSLMSTHMVNLVVGKLWWKQVADVGLYVLRPEDLAATKLAISLVFKYLRYFKTRIPSIIPLEEVNIVALPDRIGHVTGSWGLSIIRADRVLHDQDSDADHIFMVNVYIARIVAHQWFGCLITARWWDDFWITEGIVAQLVFEFTKSSWFEPLFYVKYVSSALELENMEIGDERKAVEFIRSLNEKVLFIRSGSLVQTIRNKLLKGEDSEARYENEDPKKIVVEFDKLLNNLLEIFQFSALDYKDLENLLPDGPGIRNLPRALHRAFLGPGYPILIFDSDSEGREVTVFVRGPTRKFLDLIIKSPTDKIHFQFKTFRIPIPDLQDPDYPWMSFNLRHDMSSYFRLGFTANYIKRFMKLGRMSFQKQLRVLHDAHALYKLRYVTKHALEALIKHSTGTAKLYTLPKRIEIMSILENERPSLAHEICNTIKAEYEFVQGPDEKYDDPLIESYFRRAITKALVKRNCFDANIYALGYFDYNLMAIADREAYYGVVVKYGKERQQVLLENLTKASRAECYRLVSALSRSKDIHVLNDTKKWLINSYPIFSTQTRHKFLISIEERKNKIYNFI